MIGCWEFVEADATSKKAWIDKSLTKEIDEKKA